LKKKQILYTKTQGARKEPPTRFSPPLVALAAVASASTVASASSATAKAATASAVAASVAVASSVPASAAAAAGLVGELLHLRWNLLLRFPHHLHEVPGELGLVAGDERVGGSLRPCSSGTTNTVDVVLDRSWERKVDDNSNVLDV